MLIVVSLVSCRRTQPARLPTRGHPAPPPRRPHRRTRRPAPPPRPLSCVLQRPTRHGHRCRRRGVALAFYRGRCCSTLRKCSTTLKLLDPLEGLALKATKKRGVVASKLNLSIWHMIIYTEVASGLSPSQQSAEHRRGEQ